MSLLFKGFLAHGINRGQSVEARQYELFTDSIRFNPMAAMLISARTRRERLAYMRRYRAANKERIREYGRQYRERKRQEQEAETE
jgi:hypothetical protein